MQQLILAIKKMFDLIEGGFLIRNPGRDDNEITEKLIEVLVVLNEAQRNVHDNEI